MNDTAVVPRDQVDRAPVPPQVIDPELADQLLGKAQAEGVDLLGPDGLLSQVTNAVLEPRQCRDRRPALHLKFGRPWDRCGRWSPGCTRAALARLEPGSSGRRRRIFRCPLTRNWALAGARQRTLARDVG